jgi:predicted ATP-binding protein involved in virulence
MRVNHLSLSHFRGFKELDIDFSATNLTVFIGTNGRGKSSILDLIAIHLNRFVLTFNENWNPRINRIGFLPTTNINNLSDVMNSEIKYSFPVHYPSKQLILSENNSSTNDIWDRLFLSKNGKVNSTSSKQKSDDNFLSFCENIQLASEKNPNLSLPVLVYYQANRAVNDHITNEDPLGLINEGRFTLYDNAFNNRPNNFGDFFTWFKIEEDKENELIIREKNFDIRNLHLEIVRMAITHFFNCLSGDKYANLRIIRDEKTGDNLSSSTQLIVDKNHEKLSLNQLSDGEKSVIILICDIARRLAIANPIEKNGDFSNVLKHGNGVVLIDEIDLHLHPLWQKEILQALVNTFPNLQFIVTTHSPYVVTHLDLDDKQVQVYSIEKDKVVPIQSKGKDLSTASFEIFGVERRPKMYQKAIDDLFREFEADEPNLAVLDKKFSALKKQLGETDPDVETATRILETFKIPTE